MDEQDLIDRNLKRAGDSNQANYSELTYEAYGHGGVGIVIESLTDNNNRTNSEVRDVVKKGGGKMAESGVRFSSPISSTPTPS